MNRRIKKKVAKRQLIKAGACGLGAGMGTSGGRTVSLFVFPSDSNKRS